MALLWFDGFDHYGLDETKLIEGPYDQVDAAFTLSEVNPRTGARCLRRDSSINDNSVVKSFGGQKTTVGVGGAFYLSQLPNTDASYELLNLKDSSSNRQVSVGIKSDGSVVARFINLFGPEIGLSESGVINVAVQTHIECGFIADLPDEELSLLNLCFVLDGSGSMLTVVSGIKTRWDIQVEEISASLHALKGFTGAFIGVVIYGLVGGIESLFKQVSSDSDIDDLIAEVENFPIVIGNDTNWTEGMQGAADFFDFSTSLVTPSIIFTTDGFPSNFEGDTAQEITDAAIAVRDSLPGVQVHVINIDLDVGSTEFSDQLDNTGGSVTVLSTDSGEIQQAVSGAITDISISADTGVVEVRVDGVTVISESSVPTAFSGQQEYSSVSLVCGGGDHGVTTDIDDFFIWDDQGAWNNSFLGDKRALLRFPNADTILSDFDPSSGNFGYQMIDEDSPDEDATFILSESAMLPGSPPSGSSEFEIQNLPNGVSHIAGVSVFTRASKTDAQDVEVFTSVISGTAAVSSSPHEVAESYGYHIDLYEYDPATIANFAREGFNAARVSITADFTPEGGSPGEAPAAPSSLVANRDGGYSAAFITWVDNSDDETSFELQYDTDVGFGSPTTVNPAANATVHRVSGLTRGQTYYFRIRAVNGAGSSAWSNTDSAAIFQLSDVTLYAEYDANAGVFQDSGTTPIASDGDPVGQVQDQTGNGRHITQTTASAKPVWKTNQLNGLPVIRNDVGDMLQAATAADWKFMHDGTEFAAFVVWKTTNTDPDAAYVLMDTGGLTSGEVGFSSFWDNRSAVPRTDQQVLFIAKGTVGTFFANPVTATSTVTSNAWHIHSARLTAAVLESHSDGQFSKSNNASRTGTPSGSNPQSAITVGARYNNTFNLVGDWARILIVSGSIDDNDHRAVQDYLAETYDPFMTRFFGSETVVQHDTSGLDHNGFPGLGLADSNDLILGYSKNTSHAAQDGKLVYRISSDRGATWGSEITLWDYAVEGGGTDLWFTPRFTTLADGRIMMAVGKVVSQASVVDGVGYFESSDNGQTWSGPTQLTEAIFTDHSREGGGIIELANGDLLYPYYGKDSADAANRRSCAVLRSTDGGATWSALATIADGPADGRDYVEPGLVQSDDGTVIAMIRQETGVDLYISKSTDNGATWSAPALAIAGVSGLMTPTKLASGAIIAPQRSQALSGIPTEIIFSQNDGVTWQRGRSFAQSPNTGAGQMVYGQFVEDGNGEIYLAYGYEDSTGAISDIMFVKSD